MQSRDAIGNRLNGFRPFKTDVNTWLKPRVNENAN